MPLNTWLQYLIGFSVACHGLTYALFPFFAPGVVEQKYGRIGSHLLRTMLADAGIERAVFILHMVAGIAHMACGVAIVLAL